MTRVAQETNKLSSSLPARSPEQQTACLSPSLSVQAKLRDAEAALKAAEADGDDHSREYTKLQQEHNALVRNPH